MGKGSSVTDQRVSSEQEKEAIANAVVDLRMLCGTRHEEWMHTPAAVNAMMEFICVCEDLCDALILPFHPPRVRSVEEETDRLVARMEDIYTKIDRAALRGAEVVKLRGALPARARMPSDQAGLLAFARSLLDRLALAEAKDDARIMENDLYLVRMAINRLERAMARLTKPRWMTVWDRAFASCLLTIRDVDAQIGRCPPDMPFVKAYSEARMDLAALIER